ncbi:pectinesterase inhibitor 10-like [Vitis riparia]|uniref:pectinesterase inhibitor 10-like n=1 Tax=Vitis riparia TaxID=96939 RepID=UPI00155A96BC|nr:pectinesterase inhibitor 10-like [Vitis riparia]
MELKINQSLLIFSFFSLIFLLNHAESVCVPRHASKQADSPDQVPEVSPQPQPVPSSPPTKSASSPPPKSSSPSSSSSSSSSSQPPPPSDPPSDSPDGTMLFDTGLMGRGPGFVSNTFKPFLDSKTDPSDGALNHICKKTDYSDLCLSSLAPLFDGHSDPVSMLYVAIKACTQHAQLSLNTAQKIAEAPSTNPTTASNLSDCQDSYSDALDNLQAANDALGIRDFGAVNSMLSAVVTDASDCQDLFPGKSSPMLHYEVKLRQMASNCLAIASLAT